MSKTNFLITTSKTSSALYQNQIMRQIPFISYFSICGFWGTFEEIFPQPRSSTSSTIDYFVYPNVVASFLPILFASSSDFHVDVELSNRKWKLEFGGYKPNPKITKFWYFSKRLFFIFGAFHYLNFHFFGICIANFGFSKIKVNWHKILNHLEIWKIT
jgi:hypothetical protein